MLSTEEILDQVSSLPVEERAQLADIILQSLNKPNAEIDKHWIKVAKRRLDELRLGKVQAIPGYEVFEEVIRPK